MTDGPILRSPLPPATLRGQVWPVLRLAVPIVMALAGSTLLGVTDAIMLAPLGPVPLAAAGLATAAVMVVYSVVWGILSILAVRIGAAHGARARRRIPGLIRNGLALGLLVGLAAAAAMGAIWFALPHAGQPPEVLAAMPGYWAWISASAVPFAVLTAFKAAFDAIDRPWLGTAFAWGAVVLNVPLNYALIWGAGPLPALGLTGAGIATFAAETLALAAAVLWWARARGARRLRLPRPLSRAEIGGALAAGLPLGLMYLAETGALAVAMALIGTFGTLALAANQVAFTLGGVLYMVPLGMAGAVAVRVAQEQGAGRLHAVRPVVWAGLALVTTWLVGSALLLGLGGRGLAAIITDDARLIPLAASLMLVFACMQVFDGIQTTMTGALRGLSDTFAPAVICGLGFWGGSLPAAWVIAVAWGLGPVGVWLGWLAGMIVVGGLLFRRVLRLSAPARPPAPAPAPADRDLLSA